MSDAVKNFCLVDVSTGYDASATSIVLTTNHGQLLPLPSSDGAFNAVWWNSTDYPDPALQHRAYVLGTETEDAEIIRVTSRSTDTLTITRAQEGTTATTHNKSGKTYSIMLGVTAKTMPLRATKTSDQTVNNSAVLQDDTELKVTVGINTVYIIKMVLLISAQVSSTFKAQFSAPSGTSYNMNVRYSITNSSTWGSFNTTSPLIANGAPNYVGSSTVEVAGTITTSSTAGVFKLQWCQAGAFVEDTKVLTGSFMELK